MKIKKQSMVINCYKGQGLHSKILASLFFLGSIVATATALDTIQVSEPMKLKQQQGFNDISNISYFYYMS